MPSMTARIALVLIVLGCGTQVYLNLEHSGALAVFAKMTAASGFVMLALASGALQSRYGKTILAGLCFSWFGDLFLAGGTDTLFLFGLVAFLFGHVAYTVAFFLHGVVRNTVMIALAATGVAGAIIGPWLLPYVPEPMAIPVIVYIVVISTMVAMAFGARAAAGSWLIPVGAVMFYVSDLSVASGQFVKPDFPNYVWGLPLYFGGQALLALSVAAASRNAQLAGGAIPMEARNSAPVSRG